MSQVLPHLGFLGGSMGNESARQYRRRRRHSFHLWIRKIPWRRAGQPTPVFLPEESHGQRSLAGCSPRGHKESDTAERLRMCAPSLMFNFVFLLLKTPSIFRQFSCSAMSDSLPPYGLRHARPPCPSPTPGVPWWLGW